jgi:hypothetical protein
MKFSLFELFFYEPASVKSFSEMQMRGDKPPLWLSPRLSVASCKFIPLSGSDVNEADALR